jgi:uncharacterized protein (TIGR02611 family)
MAAEPEQHELIRRLRERRDRHKERSRIYRAVFAVAGFTVTLAGVIMLVTPGPALVVIPVGLAMLALEFAWAERMLERTVNRMEQATETVKRASRAQQILLGLLAVLVAAAGVTAAYAWDVPLLPV